MVKALPEAQHTYVYETDEGEPYAAVLRNDGDNGSTKEVWQWTWEPGEGWESGGPSGPHPPYNLHQQYTTAEADFRTVLIVEGEKCARSLKGQVQGAMRVTTWLGGSGNWHRTDWGPLARHNVTLVPDSDEPGVRCMRELGDHLTHNLGCAVSFIDPTDERGNLDGTDIADWLAAGTYEQRTSRGWDWGPTTTTTTTPPTGVRGGGCALGYRFDGSRPPKSPRPDLVRVRGGTALFYSARSNWIYGKTDSGKSLLALMAVVDAVELGGRAVYLDAEDEPDEFARRVHALYGRKRAGVLLRSDDLAYIPWTTVVASVETSREDARTGRTREAGSPWVDEVADWLGSTGPRLVVVDSAIATGSGIDADSFTAWRDGVVSVWPTGTGLLVVDHQPYRTADREAGPIGSSAKKALVRGSVVEVNVVEPWNRRDRGSAELILRKDKPGHVGRRETAVAKLVAVPSKGGRRLSLRVEATTPGTSLAEEDRGERLRKAILEAVAGEPGIHSEKLVGLCPGRPERARAAVREMAESGLIERVRDGRAIGHHPVTQDSNVVQLPGLGS